MIKLLKRLKNNNGFTLVEVSISAVAMASLLSIFALLPNYKMGIARVDLKQKAMSITSEITAQLESNSNDNAIPSVIIDGANNGLPILVPTAGNTVEDIAVTGRRNNTTFTVTLSSLYVDATDTCGDEGISDNCNDGSHTGKIVILVEWQGHRPDSITQEVVTYNTALFN